MSLLFTRRRLGLLLAGVLAVVALTACHAGSQIVVRPDGSGTFSTIVTVQGPAGAALYSEAAKSAAGSGVPLVVSHYSADGETGAKISAPFKSLDDLTSLSKHLGSSAGLGGVTVTRGAAGWVFAASTTGGLVSGSSTRTGAPGGVINGSQLGGIVHMSVSVDLPGAPGGTNADTVTHTATATQFVWKLTLGRKATDLTAATTFVAGQAAVPLSTAITPVGPGSAVASSSSSSTGGLGGGAVAGIVIGGVAALALLVVGILLVTRARRTRAV